MNFDATITLGTVIQTIMFLAVIIGAYVRIRERLISLEMKVETKLSPIWRWWSEYRAQEREDWQKHVDGRIDQSVRSAVQAALWQARRDRDVE